MHSKNRDNIRKLDEYEERLSRTLNEMENFKRISEKLQIENSDLKR